MKNRFTRSLICAVFALLCIFTQTKAQGGQQYCGIYADDFMAAARCPDLTSFRSKMTSLGYAYYAPLSKEGVTETFQCTTANEDGTFDLVNYKQYTEDDETYNEVMFSTNRYHSYDALTQIMFTWAFKADTVNQRFVAKANMTATQTTYYSQLKKDLSMITQVFPSSPGGMFQQYYVTLLFIHKD